MENILPIAVLFPLVASISCYFVAKKHTGIREWLFIGITAVEFILCGLMCYTVFSDGDISFSLNNAVGCGLNFKADNFRIIYACISIFLWLMTVTFSKEYMKSYHAKERYYFFYMVTLTGVMGVFLSDDLFTTFCFFEIMSFASYPLVIHEENRDAMKAGETYLGVAVISGMILLVGLFFIYTQASTLQFDALREFYGSNSLTSLSIAGGIMVLLGFGAKAGMYPLHIWLPKAHPVAPAPASALLSGILTKSGIFGIIVICADIFAGFEPFAFLLLSLAVITMFLGAFLALFSTNLKRTLACSSMSQIGFILVGASFTLLLGKEGGLAQCGTLLHMANHSLIKLVLFMSAGVIAMNIHALELNDIRGFGRKKPFLAVVFAIGALGIMGIPLFNGYVSKTMIHEGIVEYIKEEALTGVTYGIFKGVEWIFLISGGLTVAYMTKLFVCIFIEKNKDSEKQKKFDSMKNYLSPLSKAVFVISASVLPVIGIVPNIVNKNIVSSAYEFFGVERFAKDVEFFSFECLKGGVISILIGAFVYAVFVRKVFIKSEKYVNLWPASLDIEEKIYRPIIIKGTLGFIKYFVSYISAFFEVFVVKGTVLFTLYIVRFIADFFEIFIVKGTILFTLYIVRFFAYIFDWIILFTDKTILKEHIYEFKVESAANRIGDLIASFSKNKSALNYASKLDSLAETFNTKVMSEYNSFSFAFAMISLGIIIVLLFALLR